MKRCLFDFPHTAPPSPGWHQEKMKIFILRDLLFLIVEVSGNNDEQKHEMEEKRDHTWMYSSRSYSWLEPHPEQKFQKGKENRKTPFTNMFNYKCHQQPYILSKQKSFLVHFSFLASVKNDIVFKWYSNSV